MDDRYVWTPERLAEIWMMVTINRAQSACRRTAREQRAKEAIAEKQTRRERRKSRSWGARQART
jgi:hypothetical protein